MENEDENVDSQNNEEKLNSKNQETTDVDALKQQAKELSDKNRQLFERAKKAETEAKELKEFKAKAEATPKSQSNDLDYGKMAYLAAKEINEAEDVEFIENEAKATGKSLIELLEYKYIQEKLQMNRETREAKAGLPPGSNRAGGGSLNTVEYHLAKGTTPEDQELAEKVVEARMKRESNNKFSDELYIG